MPFLSKFFKNFNLCTSYIKQIMNVFSFVQWNKYFHSVKDEMYHSTRFASLNGTFHLSPHENICTITLINIHYLYTNYLSWVYVLVISVEGVLNYCKDVFQSCLVLFWYPFALLKCILYDIFFLSLSRLFRKSSNNVPITYTPTKPVVTHHSTRNPSLLY